jgi:integrase
MKKSLTALTLAAFKAGPLPYYVSDTKQDGLRVRIATDGRLTWNVTVRVKGQRVKSVSLGVCDPSGSNGLNLTDARERAAQIVKAARMGQDLIFEEAERRRINKQALDVLALIKLYSAEISNARRSGGALRTADDINRRLLRALSGELNTKAEMLTRGEISRLLDPVAVQYPREAEKRRQSIGAMYKWALAKGYVESNPVFGLQSYGFGDLRDRTLSMDELCRLWRWLDEGAGGMPGDAISVIKVQILTGARVGEVAGMSAEELELQKETIVWTLPASRSKNKRIHVRPLPSFAREIVERALAKRSSGALFRTMNGDRALRSDDIGLALNHRKRPISHFTTHDLRRTVVSQLDELMIPLDTIAAVIGHQRGNRDTRTLIRHYSRPNLDARIQEALDKWQLRLTELLACENFK